MEITFCGDKLIKPDVQADFSKAEACICMSCPNNKECKETMQRNA